MRSSGQCKVRELLEARSGKTEASANWLGTECDGDFHDLNLQLESHTVPKKERIAECLRRSYAPEAVIWFSDLTSPTEPFNA